MIDNTNSLSLSDHPHLLHGISYVAPTIVHILTQYSCALLSMPSRQVIPLCLSCSVHYNPKHSSHAFHQHGTTDSQRMPALPYAIYSTHQSLTAPIYMLYICVLHGPSTPPRMASFDVSARTEGRRLTYGS